MNIVAAMQSIYITVSPVDFPVGEAWLERLDRELHLRRHPTFRYEDIRLEGETVHMVAYFRQPVETVGFVANQAVHMAQAAVAATAHYFMYDLEVGSQIIYVPPQAGVMLDHSDCQRGFVVRPVANGALCRFWRAHPPIFVEATDTDTYVPRRRLVAKDSVPQATVVQWLKAHGKEAE